MSNQKEKVENNQMFTKLMNPTNPPKNLLKNKKNKHRSPQLENLLNPPKNHQKNKKNKWINPLLENQHKSL